MPLPDAFLAVLSLLHQRLDGMPHPWVFTGSVGMLLQGMELTPRDIDLQADEAGAYELERRLAEFVTRPVYLRESETIRSHFGALVIGGIEVEIMGEMANRQADGSWGAPADFARHTRWVTFAGLKFPVLDLAYEEAAYARMGRLAKVALIHNFRVARDGE